MISDYQNDMSNKKRENISDVINRSLSNGDFASAEAHCRQYGENWADYIQKADLSNFEKETDELILNQESREEDQFSDNLLKNVQLPELDAQTILSNHYPNPFTYHNLDLGNVKRTKQSNNKFLSPFAIINKMMKGLEDSYFSTTLLRHFTNTEIYSKLYAIADFSERLYHKPIELKELRKLYSTNIDTCFKQVVRSLDNIAFGQIRPILNNITETNKIPSIYDTKPGGQIERLNHIPLDEKQKFLKYLLFKETRAIENLENTVVKKGDDNTRLYWIRVNENVNGLSSYLGEKLMNLWLHEDTTGKKYNTYK